MMMECVLARVTPTLEQAKVAPRNSILACKSTKWNDMHFKNSKHNLARHLAALKVIIKTKWYICPKVNDELLLLEDVRNTDAKQHE